MAGYRIESVDESAPCPRGREHLKNASIRNGLMPNEIKSADELQAMQAKGDAFVLVVGGKNELDWPRVTFDECVCGNGIVMIKRKSAKQEIQDAINESDSEASSQ